MIDIECSSCKKWLHRKCVYTQKRNCSTLSTKNNSYLCSKKCTNTLFPFYNISTKEFLRVNKDIIKFPCKVCTNECHKKMKRIRCETCLRWSHLDCTFLSSSLKSVVGKSYFCTVKCELQSLPFCSVKNEDLDIFMKQKRRHRDCKIVPQHQRISKFREENYFKKSLKFISYRNVNT